MLEKIDKYFNNGLSLSERQDFENQLVDDSELKETVSFYLNTRNAAKQLADDTRRIEFEALREELSQRSENTGNTKTISWLIRMAALLVLVIGIWWISRPQMIRGELPNDIPIEVVADKYIKGHFQNLPVKMDATADSLQMGLRLFNEQKLTEAQSVFENILKRKNDDSEALKYAGITALQLKEYDKAIQHFQNLASQKYLFSNPGKFYQALALIKKSPDNHSQAMKLLNDVYFNDLEGAIDAIEFGAGGRE
jgi:tetratricopeptide (TPR) repeat protein